MFGKNCDEVKAVNTITGSPRPPPLLVNPPLNFRSDHVVLVRGRPITGEGPLPSKISLVSLFRPSLWSFLLFTPQKGKCPV